MCSMYQHYFVSKLNFNVSNNIFKMIVYVSFAQATPIDIDLRQGPAQVHSQQHIYGLAPLLFKVVKCLIILCVTRNR